MKLTFTSSVTSCSRQGVLVEEILDAIYPDLGSGNKPGLNHLLETITRFAGGGRGTLEIKTSRGMLGSG
jgi:hypothetical protein